MEKPKYGSIGHALNKLKWKVVMIDKILLMELVGNNIQNIYLSEKNKDQNNIWNMLILLKIYPFKCIEYLCNELFKKKKY